jgi:hypothetical protein
MGEDDMTLAATGITIGLRLMRRLGTTIRNLYDPYRPELHYMRGPGPKCREKRG